jgi:hypothetical protein
MDNVHSNHGATPTFSAWPPSANLAPNSKLKNAKKKQFTKSISAVDFTNSGTSQNTNDDNDHGTNHNGTINRNAYYDVHKKKYDAMTKSEVNAYHSTVRETREKPTQVPDADGQMQYTMNKKIVCAKNITGLPGFQSCYSPGHDAFGCTLNKQLVKRSRSRPNGIKSSPAQQQTVGAVNFDPATIAMLRTAIMGQQPTTTPTATSPSPSANPAPTSTGNAGQFQQDIMQIFSHISPWPHRSASYLGQVHRCHRHRPARQRVTNCNPLRLQQPIRPRHLC